MKPVKTADGARDVYVALMIAAKRGKGLKLTADEVFDLSLDDAISARAANATEAAAK